MLKNYEVKDSNIHGKGVFATKKFDSGDFINVAITSKDHAGTIWYSTTHFGGLINHSDFPNAVTKKGKDAYYTYALNPIKIGDEITVDYTVNKDLEQPKSGWKFYNEATPNNGVWTGSRPKGEDETITALYKNSVSQGKKAKVKIDEDEHVE